MTKKATELVEQALATAAGTTHPAHPGLAKLATIIDPETDEPFTTAELLKYSPSEAAMAAAAELSTDELNHLFVDVVGAFDVTHRNYRPPSAEVYAKAGEDLVGLLTRIGNDEV